MDKDNKDTEPKKTSDVSGSFYDMLISKLMNDYNYYLDIQICCDEKESEKYQDRAEEIYSIIEWCEKNYENLNVSDVMFSFEDVKVFSQWCLENKQCIYVTDGKFWFDSKTFKILSWEEVWKIYNQK